MSDSEVTNGVSFVIPNFNGEALLRENLLFLLSEIKDLEHKALA